MASNNFLSKAGYQEDHRAKKSWPGLYPIKQRIAASKSYEGDYANLPSAENFSSINVDFKMVYAFLHRLDPKQPEKLIEFHCWSIVETVIGIGH